MDYIYKTCNDCVCINCTEEEQDILKKINISIEHRCMKFNKRLFHYDNHKGYNDIIYPCSECNFDMLIERE